MISKENISADLFLIGELFKSSPGDAKKEQLYSKMAIIELCGWIEDAMDNIVKETANPRLKIHQNSKYVEDEIIKRNYSFIYEPNFRTMLMKVIGLINLEKLENTLDTKKFVEMESALRNLKKARDTHVHKHLGGVTTSANAPSVTISQFATVYNGLEDIDKKLKQIKL